MDQRHAERAAGGAVESVVVTLQDLAPLAELERARTELLSLVSHEPRTPPAAIKGSSGPDVAGDQAGGRAASCRTTNRRRRATCCPT